MMQWRLEETGPAGRVLGPLCGEGVLSILPRHGSYRRICVWRASGEVSQAEAQDPGPGGAGPGPGAGGPGGLEGQGYPSNCECGPGQN